MSNSARVQVIYFTLLLHPVEQLILRYDNKNRNFKQIDAVFIGGTCLIFAAAVKYLAVDHFAVYFPSVWRVYVVMVTCACLHHGHGWLFEH